MVKKYCILLLIFLSSINGFTQHSNFSKQDTLRGSITPERIWWDLLHYDLDFRTTISSKSLEGSNTISYKVLSENQRMQIDLQSPMEITSVIQNNISLDYKRDGNVYYITLKETQNIDEIYEITIDFKGVPRVARNPPWDVGFTWQKDENNNDFIASTSQDGGSSIWWPCKDHMYDEPDDGVTMNITTPKHLMGVGNGRLINTKDNSDQTKTYTWEVLNPINNYGININIGDYVHFSEKYKGLKGELDCDYYVLSYNLEKAKKQFKDASRTLAAFEHWFGPYPFYEDSFKLVEAPYLGMEHQSAVTYGNDYKNGYLGSDLSGTGWGLKFDFIIIHEAGHEWFANNITYKDIADMWIHESFTAYSENLFLDYHYGTEASNNYVIGTRRLIRNDKPLIGPYNVNKKGSGDMYYKGANMLHTLRQIIDNDEKWRAILVGLNKEFYHKTVKTQQIENYINTRFKIDLKPFFNQYLRKKNIPVLEYKLVNGSLSYRWTHVVDDFTIPVKVFINDKSEWVTPSTSWKTYSLKNKISSFSVDNNFYVAIKNKSN